MGYQRPSRNQVTAYVHLLNSFVKLSLQMNRILVDRWQSWKIDPAGRTLRKQCTVSYASSIQHWFKWTYPPNYNNDNHNHDYNHNDNLNMHLSDRVHICTFLLLVMYSVKVCNKSAGVFLIPGLHTEIVYNLWSRGDRQFFLHVFDVNVSFLWSCTHVQVARMGHSIRHALVFLMILAALLPTDAMHNGTYATSSHRRLLDAGIYHGSWCMGTGYNRDTVKSCCVASN